MAAVVHCPTCKAELDANARFCPKDGTTIRPDSVLIPISSSRNGTHGGVVSGEVDLGFKATVAMGRRKKRVSTATDDPSADPLIGKLLDGRYRVKARLGQGGVGAVYEAEHVGTKKVVAVKVLHPLYASTDEFRKRFEREARAASRLSHPAIVQVSDFGRANSVEPPDEKLTGIPYLVMEFVRGQVLLDRLIDGPAIPPAEAVIIARDVLGALKHAHSLGIVHRDIKPANIMLVAATDETTPRVKLLDFGLAKELLASGGENEPLTQAGMVFGTPGYLSPEQAAGRQIDARSDLYSIGVVLFEMCCNRRLFEREDPLDAVRDHLHTPPPDPRSINAAVSPELARAILKSLEKDRDKRYADADAFVQALTATPELGAKPSQGSAPWLRPVWGRPIWQWGAAAAGALLLVGTTLSLLLGGSSSKAATPMAAHATEAAQSAPTAGPLSPNGLRHLQLAASYQKRLWCSDTLDELERALREDARLRSEPDMARVAIGCLRDKTWPKASRFLVNRLGADAREELTATVAGNGNPDVRKNAQRVLDILAKSGRIDGDPVD